MAAAGVPTAGSRTCETADEVAAAPDAFGGAYGVKAGMPAARLPPAACPACEPAGEVAAALDAFGAPYVVKDDSLAAGKGVVVTSDRDEALAHAAGCGRVVVEEFLDGPEFSIF